MNASLLIELFTEELPPRALRTLGVAFSEGIAEGLRANGLAAPHAAVKFFATPRRLAVRIDEVLAQAEAKTVELKGPSVKVGLDADGEPTQALLKWAQRQGARVEDLFQGSDGKQAVFLCRQTLPGAALDDAIQGVLEQTLTRLPIPKSMSYQLSDGRTVAFVRPAHGLIVLHGERLVAVEILGLKSARLLQGHRFQGARDLVLDHAQQYEQKLLHEGRVVASFDERRQRIRDLLNAQADALQARLTPNSGQQADDVFNALLEEVTALVEWPRVYVGAFDPAFLAVPQECLILTMQTNQKYFPLFDASGRLRAQFLIVSNMDVGDPSAIIDGNERVVRPRLDDARFFYQQDLKQNLEARLPSLERVVYHAKLGSQRERVARLEAIALAIALKLGDAGVQTPSAGSVARAARLAKCDLATAMVGEFPELQGTMGRYYAQHDGEESSVAQAVEEHYRPRFAGDSLPAERLGQIVALSDKLESLTGIWGIGLYPSGDKDPFALRRQALGVVRILLEGALPLRLSDLLAQAFASFAGLKHVVPDVGGLQNFVLDRLRAWLRGTEHAHDAATIEAALAVDAERLDQLPARLAALAAFRQLPEASALAAANKRIGNILRKSAPELLEAGLPTLLAEHLIDPAEQALASALGAIAADVEADFQAGRYTESLQRLASLRSPVDHFFDTVMVMADDPTLRANRLSLLASLHQRMNRVADLARLAG